MAEPADPAQPPMSLEEARKRFPPIWVIYDRAKDYPGHFVVRCWYGLVPEPIGCLCATLVEARKCIVNQGGCVPQGRYADDDPAILETWL